MELWEESWVTKAACRGMPLSVFYPTTGETPREAIMTCSKCPVRSECLEYALSHNLQHPYDGVWGGYTVADRRKLLRERRHDARRKRKGEGQGSGLQMG